MQSNMQMARTRGDSKFLKGFIIGGLLGSLVTLFDSATRSQLKQNLRNAKDKSVNLYTNVKNDPQDFVQHVKDTTFKMADMAKELKSDLSRVAETLTQTKSEATSLMEGAREQASQIKSEMRNVGSKVTEMGHELKQDTSSLMQTSQNQSSFNTENDQSVSQTFNSTTQPQGVTESITGYTGETRTDKKEWRVTEGPDDQSNEHTKNLGY